MPLQQHAKRFLAPVGVLAALTLAYVIAGWPATAVVFSALVTWILLQITRVVHVLRRAADCSVGYVDSAVMLHSQLRTGVKLVHVVGLTGSLGVLESSNDVQRQVFCWSDASHATVRCIFLVGRLCEWELRRAPHVGRAP